MFSFRCYVTSKTNRHVLALKIQPPMIAMMWRLCVRHSFFATGHACSFNRLQYSAAFVAFETFKYAPAGFSLCLNTFGWDIIGIFALANICQATENKIVLYYFFIYQQLETVIACISVSILKRHLMVWAVFAPRFVFSAIVLCLCSIHFIFSTYSDEKPLEQKRHQK